MNIHNTPTAANRQRFMLAANEAMLRAFDAMDRAKVAIDKGQYTVAKFRMRLAADDFDLACRYLEKLAA